MKKAFKQAITFAVVAGIGVSTVFGIRAVHSHQKAQAIAFADKINSAFAADSVQKVFPWITEKQVMLINSGAKATGVPAFNFLATIAGNTVPSEKRLIRSEEISWGGITSESEVARLKKIAEILEFVEIKTGRSKFKIKGSRILAAEVDSMVSFFSKNPKIRSNLLEKGYRQGAAVKDSLKIRESHLMLKRKAREETTRIVKANKGVRRRMV